MDHDQAGHVPASPEATGDAAASRSAGNDGATAPIDRPPKRPRKELTQEEQKARAERMWTAKKADALRKAKTPEEKKNVLDQLYARAGISKPPPPAAPAPIQVDWDKAKDAVSPTPAPPAAPPPPAGRPGWPTDAEIDAITPEVSQLWGMIGAALKKFVPELDIFTPRADLVVGEDGKPRVVQSTGHAMLVKGTAPCAAKYAPAWASTPEAVAIVAIVSVFAAPLIAMALRAAPPPAGTAPAPPPATEGAA